MSNQQLSSNLTGSALRAVAAVVLCAGVAAACHHNDPNAERSEYIEVYAAPDAETPLSGSTSVSVRAGTEKLYVKSNVDLVAKWQDDADASWATVSGFEKVGENLYELSLTHARRASTPYYTRRSGTLMLTAPELNFGSYLTVHQGLTARLASDFSWSRYGSADPRKDDGVLSSAWNNTDKNRGWESTVIAGQDNACLYGKNGYVMLGSADGYGADLYSPYVEELRVDSLLVVSFRAVAYTDLEGNRDDNRFTVEVVGGGVIRDFADQGVKVLELEAPYYDLSAEGFPGSMWQGTDFLIGIAGTDRSPLTADTRIRITAGSLSETPAAKPNRIFIDNFYIRRIVSTETVHDEDLFLLNGSRSGRDTVFQEDAEEELDNQ
ncbi:MAG: hypothetical protein IJ721_00020 [Bacteroidales bacterium]|nr:hypothetical protein [Bacteroidales bacterium]